MLTIEEYLERAKYIGRIQGAAETIEDGATRDGIYGAAEYLFGYLVEDARAEEMIAQTAAASACSTG